MKRNNLFLLAASIVILAVPTKAWADGMNEAQKVTSPSKRESQQGGSLIS